MMVKQTDGNTTEVMFSHDLIFLVISSEVWSLSILRSRGLGGFCRLVVKGI
jgi:hypothetical protein